MNPRRYRRLAALAALILSALAAVAGCGAAGGTGGAAGPSASGPTIPSATGGYPGSVAPTPPVAASPGGGSGSGSGGVTGPGTSTASLRCGAAAVAPTGPLPDRHWVAVAECPATGVRTGPVVPEPTSQPSPAVPVVVHGDLGPLVAALRQPDAPPASGVCPMYRVLMPTIWLIDDHGGTFAPRIPLGPCGQPAEAVTTALHGLGLR